MYSTVKAGMQALSRSWYHVPVPEGRGLCWISQAKKWCRKNLHHLRSDARPDSFQVNSAVAEFPQFVEFGNELMRGFVEFGE